MTSKEALQVLQESLATRNDEKAPPGSRSVEEWAAEWGLSRSHTNEILLRALKKGLATRATVKRGVAKPFYYTIKKGSKQ